MLYKLQFNIYVTHCHHLIGHLVLLLPLKQSKQDLCLLNICSTFLWHCVFFKSKLTWLQIKQIVWLSTIGLHRNRYIESLYWSIFSRKNDKYMLINVHVRQVPFSNFKYSFVIKTLSTGKKTKWISRNVFHSVKSMHRKYIARMSCLKSKTHMKMEFPYGMWSCTNQSNVVF